MTMPTSETVWMGVGFLGQGIFTARFLVQWAVSEKERDCVVPVAFWWISLGGGLTLLAYTVYKQDPPLILGQALGLFVYVRNLMILAKARRRAAKAERRAAARDAGGKAGRTRAGVSPRPARPRDRERVRVRG